MKRGSKIAAAVAGGALAAGAIAVPAFATGSGPSAGPSSPQVRAAAMAQVRVQARDRTGIMAQDQIRARDGTCLAAGTTQPVTGTLTATQRDQLVLLAEQEKLSHDLYTAFAQAYDLPVFDNLAAAEANHLQALRTLMERYGVTDPTADMAPGVFASKTMTADYLQLLAQGKTSQDAALAAARTVETDAITSYGDALDGLSAPAATQVYTNLRAAENRHLDVIGTWLAR